MDFIFQQPPSPHPLNLTRSQELAFSNVEWLQAVLEADINSTSELPTRDRDLTPKKNTSAMRSELTIYQYCLSCVH